jgi:hypothetical protein
MSPQAISASHRITLEAHPKALPTLLRLAILNKTDLAIAHLQAGANPNSSDPVAGSPLYWAAKKDNFRLAQALLAYGARPNTQELNGDIPLTQAILHKNIRFVYLLLHHQANPLLLEPTLQKQLFALFAEKGHLLPLLRYAHHQPQTPFAKFMKTAIVADIESDLLRIAPNWEDSLEEDQPRKPVQQNAAHFARKIAETLMNKIDVTA